MVSLLLEAHDTDLDIVTNLRAVSALPETTNLELSGHVLSLGPFPFPTQ